MKFRMIPSGGKTPSMPFRSAKDLVSLIRRKKIGCLELLDLYLSRIDRNNPKINAVIFMNIEEARKRAPGLRIKRWRKGTSGGPSTGLPMTVKESYDVVGMPTTWGVPAHRHNYPQRNALAVDRFLKAGAVLFGKTNVPLYLADWQRFNEIYGTTNNPWDVTRVPGGSSGWSAAALSAGLTGLEAGSDISAVGPLARSAEDLATAFKIMAGPDDIDGTGWQLRLPKPTKKSLREFKVSIVYTDPEAEVDEEVQGRLRVLAAFLRKKKVKVKEGARPKIDSQEAYKNYIQLLRAATCGRLTPEEFRKNFQAAEALDPADDSYQARAARAQTMPHWNWLAVNEARHKMRLKWADFSREYDLLLCPTATTTAFPHNQKGERWERMVMVNGKPQPSTTQMFWAGYSGNFYLPSTVAPAGLASNGLPIGVQIIGPQYGDLTCIHFAHLLEQEFQGFVPPPGFD